MFVSSHYTIPPTTFLDVCAFVGGEGLLQCNEGAGFYCRTCFQNVCTNLNILYKESEQNPQFFFHKKGLQILTDSVR